MKRRRKHKKRTNVQYSIVEMSDMEQTLRAAIDEFTATIGMLYLAQTGKQAPSSALDLIERARAEGVLPSDAYPSVREALQATSGAPGIFNRPAATLLREMYGATAWVGTRLMEQAFTSIGFTIWQGEDVPQNWGTVSNGFFAQRGPYSLYVCPLFTREERPSTPTPEAARRLLGQPYEVMREAPGFRGNLPTSVIIQTGRPVLTFSHAVIPSDGQTPSYHAFMAPLAKLDQLNDYLVSVFG